MTWRFFPNGTPDKIYVRVSEEKNPECSVKSCQTIEQSNFISIVKLTHKYSIRAAANNVVFCSFHWGLVPFQSLHPGCGRIYPRSRVCSPVQYTCS